MGADSQRRVFTGVALSVLPGWLAVAGFAPWGLAERPSGDLRLALFGGLFLAVVSVNLSHRRQQNLHLEADPSASWFSGFATLVGVSTDRLRHESDVSGVGITTLKVISRGPWLALLAFWAFLMLFAVFQALVGVGSLVGGP